MRQCFIALLSLLLLLPILAVAQDFTWQRVQVGDSVTVEFPGLPTKKVVENKAGQAHAYVFNNSRALYMIVVQENALEPEFSVAEIKQFYKGALRGGGIQAIDSKEFTINGFLGVESQFITPDHPKLPAVKFMRVIVVNGTAYIQNFWTSTKEAENLAAS